MGRPNHMRGKCALEHLLCRWRCCLSRNTLKFTIGKSTSRALNDTHPLTRFLIPSTASITIRPLFGIPRSSGLFLLFPVVVTITSRTAVAYRVRIVPSTEIKFTIFILIIQTLTFFRGYGIQRTSFDYEFMLNRRPTTYMLVCWTIVIPLVCT
uniref:Putative sodium-neurotransmitter symporter n=1 Tax=Ixodes ricinus TaxID=34613 RepID=A0A0K8RA59_IXORI